MKSTLVLYEDSQILIDKNIKVDYIGDYLNTLTKLTLNNLNYIEPKRELSLKIELSQTNLDIGSDNTHNYNYAKVTTDNVDYFYFITNYKWIAVSVIAIDLYMDTINSFVFKNQGATGLVDYEITPKSLIHRQHKDRWEFDEEHTPALIPIIDRVNEGINPNLIRTLENVIEAKDNYLNQKWYIVYKNENAIDPDSYNEVNPVNILIRPELDTPVLSRYGTSLQSIDFQDGDTFFMSSIGNTRDFCPLRFNCDGTHFYVKEYWGEQGGSAGYIREYIRVHKDSSQSVFLVQLYRAKYSAKTGGAVLSNTLVNQISPTNIIIDFAPYKLEAHYQDTIQTTPVSESVNKVFYGSGTKKTANSIDSLDRTDSKLIKIIELPYCPLEVIEDTLSYKYIIFKYPVQVDEDGNIELDESYFNYTKKRYKLKSKLSIGNKLLPQGVLDVLDDYTYHRLLSDNPKSIILESKLYSSEFYQGKLVYDSFSLPIKNEFLDFYIALQRIIFDEDIFLELITPTTIASKFGFSFEGMTYNEAEEDYPLFLPIARNNEEPIYTSQYINYLRTGFNYDLKAKNQQAGASGIGIGLATLGAVAGIGLGIASNNPAVLAGSVISAITAVTSAVTSAVNTAITNQRSIEQKLAQAKAQAVSIQASDDIDLLNAYANGNRAKICHYKPTESMEKNIFDLFYYTGYTIEKLGLPDTTSRMRFNYVSADIDIIMQKHLPKDIVDDIKARWSLGITFIHKLTTDLTRYPYNFEQDLENWEWSLEDAIQVSE